MHSNSDRNDPDEVKEAKEKEKDSMIEFLKGQPAELLYKGYSDGEANTDNAWVEIALYTIRIDEKNDEIMRNFTLLV